LSEDDEYTYPGSHGVLVNKFGIRDADELDTVMNRYATAAWARAAVEAPPSVFEFSYLQAIHRKMFGALFEWAGDVRDVDTKAGDTGIVYARPRFIGDGIAELFLALEQDDYLLTVRDPSEFSERLAAHWAYLSHIHPFRDGNTRSQSLFISSLASAAGHDLDWRTIDVDELRSARLRAIQGEESGLAFLIRKSITGEEAPELRVQIPVFSVDQSNSGGVAASELGRCGRPRSNGRGSCMRRIGEDGCPYHG
jgi:cell filamentation protein